MAAGEPLTAAPRSPRRHRSAGADDVAAPSSSSSSTSSYLTDDLWLTYIIPRLDFAELCALERTNRRMRRLAGSRETWRALCARHGFDVDVDQSPLDASSPAASWKERFRDRTEKIRRRKRQARSRRILRLASEAQAAETEVRRIRARLRGVVEEERSLRRELQAGRSVPVPVRPTPGRRPTPESPRTFRRMLRVGCATPAAPPVWFLSANAARPGTL